MYTPHNQHTNQATNGSMYNNQTWGTSHTEANHLRATGTGSFSTLSSEIGAYHEEQFYQAYTPTSNTQSGMMRSASSGRDDDDGYTTGQLLPVGEMVLPMTILLTVYILIKSIRKHTLSHFMKKLSCFLCALFLLNTTLYAQTTDGYLTSGDYVTISYNSNPASWGGGTFDNRYLEASNSGLIAKTGVTDNCLWQIFITQNGASYSYTFRDVTTQYYLAIENNNTNQGSLKLVANEAAASAFQIQNTSHKPGSYLHGEMYYMGVAWGQPLPLYLGQDFSVANWNPFMIYIEKWEQHGAGDATTHFNPAKVEFTYAKDDNEAKQQEVKAHFVMEATTETYFQCVNRPNEMLLNRKTMGVDPKGVTNVKVYWKSTGDDKGKDSELDLIDYNQAEEDSNRIMMRLSNVIASTNSWEFTITPQGKSPMGLALRRFGNAGVGTGTLEEWVDYIDNVVVEYDYNGETLTQEMRVIRKAYHEEAMPEIMFSINPATYTFSRFQETKAFDVTLTHQHGTTLYNVDNQVIDTTHTYGPVHVKLTDFNTHFTAADSWTKSYKFLHQPAEPWLTLDESQFKANGNIYITAKQNNGTFKRSDTIVITLEKTAGEHLHKDSFMIPLHQRAQAGGIQFYTQAGAGASEQEKEQWNNRTDRQQVHTSERIIYYLPNDEIELRLPESGYSGYMRWYDYKTNADPYYNEDPKDSTDWIRSPRAANNNPFSAINTPQDASDLSHTEDGLSFGFYAVNKADKGILDEDNTDNPAPILKGWNYTNVGDAYHTMACDVSAYTDYKIHYNQTNTTRIDSITEPTLSYRQLFHMRPAQEIADTLRARNNRGEYLEEYHYQAPAGKQILLSTEHRHSKVRSHASELCYFYYGSGSKIYRIDGRNGQNNRTNLKWYVSDADGSNKQEYATQYVAAMDYLIVRSDIYPVTKIYTLELPEGSNNGNEKLLIARFVVDFVDIEKNGPTKRTIITPQRIKNEYKELGYIHFNDEASHLPWHYTTYGYVYNDVNYKRGANQGLFPFYGEYTILESVNKDWAKASAHGNTGKALYVDGTMEPGLVATISTNAVICSGQTMYCSAWFCNPSPSGWGGSGNTGNPIFRCNIQGRKKINETEWSEWENAGVYFVGELLQASDWQQIVFPIESAYSYDETRVSIYNFATTNQGNDFMVDDITLYVSQLPIVAYQGKMACRSTSEGITSAAAVLRLDYSNINVGSDGYMYYQIYNETLDEEVHLIEDAAYYHEAHIGEEHHGEDYYGSVHIPEVTFDPEEENKRLKQENPSTTDTLLIYTSVSAFLDNLIADGKKHGKAYIKTNNSGVTKWLLYVAHIITNVLNEDLENKTSDEQRTLRLQNLYEKDNYSMRMAHAAEELKTPECNMTTPLHATQQTVFSLRNSHEETILHAKTIETHNKEEKEVMKANQGGEKYFLENSVDNCANDTYFLTSTVVNHLAVNGVGTMPENVVAPIFSDWLIGDPKGDVLSEKAPTQKKDESDDDFNQRLSLYNTRLQQAVEGFKDMYGYTPDEVTTAIMYDMRRNEPENTNYSAKTFEELDASKFLSLQNYEIIQHLCEHEWLQLYDTTVYFYLSSRFENDKFMGDTVRYWCFPIAETAKTTVMIGDEPVEVTLKDCNEPHRVFVTAAGTNYYLNTTPLDTKDKTPQQRVQFPTVKVVANEDNKVNKVTLPVKEIAGNNDAKNVKIGNEAIPDNITIDLSQELPKYLEFFDLNQGKVISKPSSLNAGEEYTMRLIFQDAIGQTHLENNPTSCRVGQVFFTIQVVPNLLVWQPTGHSFNGWGKNENWKGWIDDGDHKIEEGELIRGFVPMTGTDVVIPKLANPLLAPYIVPEDDHDHYPMTVHHDQHACRNIYFAPDAHINNQHLLTYEKAYVDMFITPSKWTTMSAPLQDMYSGDMFVPHEGLWNAENPKRESTNPFEVKSFTGQRHDDAAYAFKQAFFNQTVELQHENNGKTIISPTTDFTHANTLEQALHVGEGYNMKGYGPGNPQKEDTLIIRLPKPDVQYYYYSPNGDLTSQSTSTLNRENAHKLAFTPTEGTMTLTLNNETEGDEFLLGNPTMAYIDMKALLKTNEKQIEPTFKYMMNNTWHAASVDVPVQSEDRYLPPMRSALIKAKTNTTTLQLDLKVEHLTLNNQVLYTRQAEESTPASAPRRVKAIDETEAERMTIYAINKKGYARTLVVATDNAEDAFLSGEDALFASSGIGTKNTVVTSPLNMYTCSDNMPLMVDVRRNIDSIPVALLVKDNARTEEIQFAFYLSSNWTRECYFCDRVTGQRYRIMDGLILTLPMSDNHETRYYIDGPDESDFSGNNGGTATDTPEAQLQESDISHLWTSSMEAGSLTVTSNNSLKAVSVYDITGRLITEQYLPVRYNQVQFDLPSGIYVVEATFHNNTKQHVKALVR